MLPRESFGRATMLSNRFTHHAWAFITYLASTVIAVAQEPQPPADVPTLPPVRIEGTAPSTQTFTPQDTGLTGTILDGTIFSNPPATGYRAPTTSTGTIIAVPDADLPFTVSPITRDVMDDQIALRVT